MRNLLLTSLLSAAFALSAMASEPAKPTEAGSEVTKPATATTEKDKKHHSKMTKEEKIAHRTTEIENLYASITEKAKTLTGKDKKMADLALAHAKLEIDASKDEDMKGHTMAHLAKADRYLKNADKHMGKTTKSGTSAVEEKKAEEKK